MSTVNNPFSDLLSIMREQGAVNNPPGLKLGTVKSINPIIISVDGLELNESFVKVSESLKPHKRKVKMNGDFNINLNTPYTPTVNNYTMPNKVIGLKANASASQGSVSVTITGDNHSHGTHNHTVSSLNGVIEKGNFTGSIEYTDWLIKEGDTVVVLSSNDNQSYVVIAKI